MSPSNCCLKHQDHWVRWYLITTQNYTDYTPGIGLYELAAGEICRLFHVNLPPKSQNLMMSVFSSNTLIFCCSNAVNASLEAQISKFFQGACLPTPLATCTFGAHTSCLWCEFFPSLGTPKLLHLLKTLLKTLQVVNESNYLQSRLLFHYRVRIKCVNGKLHKYRTWNQSRNL